MVHLHLEDSEIMRSRPKRHIYITLNDTFEIKEKLTCDTYKVELNGYWVGVMKVQNDGKLK